MTGCTSKSAHAKGASVPTHFSSSKRTISSGDCSSAGSGRRGRKLGAEALRESEARFRALTELSSDWYWEQDENLRFTYLSTQANELTGYSSESSIGKTRWELAA